MRLVIYDKDSKKFDVLNPRIFDLAGDYTLYQNNPYVWGREYPCWLCLHKVNQRRCPPLGTTIYIISQCNDAWWKFEYCPNHQVDYNI